MWQVLFFLLNIMEYSKDYINELMKHCDPFSVLALGFGGELIRLYCPFSVMVIYSVGKLNRGDVVLVEAVKITLELKDVFIIEGKAYYIIHFRIFI